MRTNRIDRLGLTHVAAALTGMFILSTSALGQEGLPQGPPPVPDLTGRWAPVTCFPDGETCPFVVADTQFTRVGANLIEAFEEPTLTVHGVL